MPTKPAKPRAKTPMKLDEIARRIDSHLRGFYAHGNPLQMWSPCGTGGSFAMYSGGSKIALLYVSYQGPSYLTKAEAIAYLEALDGGYVGRHFYCPAVVKVREAKVRR